MTNELYNLAKQVIPEGKIVFFFIGTLISSAILYSSNEPHSSIFVQIMNKKVEDFLFGNESIILDLKVKYILFGILITSASIVLEKLYINYAYKKTCDFLGVNLKDKIKEWEEKTPKNREPSEKLKNRLELNRKALAVLKDSSVILGAIVLSVLFSFNGNSFYDLMGLVAVLAFNAVLGFYISGFYLYKVFVQEAFIDLTKGRRPTL